MFDRRYGRICLKKWGALGPSAPSVVLRNRTAQTSSTFATPRSEQRRRTAVPLVFPNAPSGLALRKLEHLILLQQGIHGFPEQILLGPTVFFRELVQQFNLHVIQIQSNLGS